jgi:hypothetical protein
MVRKITVTPSIEPHKTLKQITKFIEDSVLASYHLLCITSATADLDAKFEMSLGSLALDMDGKLVQTYTLSGTSAISLRSRSRYSPHLFRSIPALSRLVDDIRIRMGGEKSNQWGLSVVSV